MSMDEISAYYSGLQVDMPYKFITVIIMYIISIVVIIGGVQKGLERANKILIPGLFIFLIILSIRNLMLPDAMEGVKWMWTPDFSKLDSSVIMAALNQCIFFSGVGMATLFSFGSYLNNDADIPFYGVVCMLSNVVVGILAGTAIFTALFSYGMDVTAGSGLVFQTMPYVFNEMAAGTLWGGLFFILVFCAGLSTILGLYEGAASVLGDAVGWSRKKSVLLSGIILFILGIPTILSTTAWANVTPLGMDLFTFMDFVAMLITCPIALILISIFAGTSFWDRYMEHSAIGAKYFKVPRFLKFWYIICIPIITGAVVIIGIMGYF
jgi:NSS family neurotransmitter:Na+ symporter